MLTRSRTVLALLVAGLVVAAGACGNDDDPDTASAPEDTAATTVASGSDRDYGYGDSGNAGATGGTVAVEVADSDLGEILAVGGLTLYAFLPDDASSSTCTGDCAASWPPLMADSVEPGDGLDAGDFATISRDDGGKQVTFHGWPLYYYVGDMAPGDTSGQGLGQSWYVVAPDGALVGT